MMCNAGTVTYLSLFSLSFRDVMLYTFINQAKRVGKRI